MTSADIRTHGSHQFMTVVEIAATMRVSRATVHRLLDAGHLHSTCASAGLCGSPRVAVETYVRTSALHSSGT